MALVLNQLSLLHCILLMLTALLLPTAKPQPNSLGLLVGFKQGPSCPGRVSLFSKYRHFSLLHYCLLVECSIYCMYEEALELFVMVYTLQ